MAKTVYSAEIATPKLRGRLTVLTSMSIAVGILMIYILGYVFPVSEHDAEPVNEIEIPIDYFFCCRATGASSAAFLLCSVCSP